MSTIKIDYFVDGHNSNHKTYKNIKKINKHINSVEKSIDSNIDIYKAEMAFYTSLLDDSLDSYYRICKCLYNPDGGTNTNNQTD